MQFGGTTLLLLAATLLILSAGVEAGGRWPDLISSYPGFELDNPVLTKEGGTDPVFQMKRRFVDSQEDLLTIFVRLTLFTNSPLALACPVYPCWFWTSLDCCLALVSPYLPFVPRARLFESPLHIRLPNALHLASSMQFGPFYCLFFRVLPHCPACHGRSLP